LNTKVALVTTSSVNSVQKRGKVNQLRTVFEEVSFDHFVRVERA
jgi:hypothetical protein